MDADVPATTELVTEPTRRPARKKLVLALGGIVVLAGLAIAIVVSFNRGNPYASFRSHCLATSGSTVVTLSVATHSQYMGGAAKTYSMGCREANGTISATAKTNQP